jgi:predicted DNA-binding transcriptional regulator AlpA
MTTYTAHFLTVGQTAGRLNVSKSTIWRWAQTRPDFPGPIKLGPGITRWSLSDIEAFETNLLGITGNL